MHNHNTKPIVGAKLQSDRSQQGWHVGGAAAQILPEETQLQWREANSASLPRQQTQLVFDGYV